MSITVLLSCHSRLPTASVRARFQAKSCEIFGGSSGTGACFLQVLRFPLPTTPYSLIILSSSLYIPGTNSVPRPPVRWLPGTLSSGIKRPECEADRSPQSSSQVKNNGGIFPLFRTPCRVTIITF
jgi:hypothetical protein